MTLELYRKTNVFSRCKHRTGVVWLPVGKAICHRDGSIQVELDITPLDGKFLIADTAPKSSPQFEELHAS